MVAGGVGAAEVTVTKTVVFPLASVVPLDVVMVPVADVTVQVPVIDCPVMPFPFASSNVSEIGSVVGVVDAGTLGHAEPS